jgi:hypothetical protein
MGHSFLQKLIITGSRYSSERFRIDGESLHVLVRQRHGHLVPKIFELLIVTDKSAFARRAWKEHKLPDNYPAGIFVQCRYQTRDDSI